MATLFGVVGGVGAGEDQLPAQRQRAGAEGLRAARAAQIPAVERHAAQQARVCRRQTHQARAAQEQRRPRIAHQAGVEHH